MRAYGNLAGMTIPVHLGCPADRISELGVPGTESGENQSCIMTPPHDGLARP